MQAIMLQQVSSVQYCYLTTTGRTTGKQHEIEIWFAVDPERPSRMYMISGGRDRSDWVKNLRRMPGVQVRIQNETYPGTAEFIENKEDDRLARELLATKYQGWSSGSPLTNWARTGLPVAIDLDRTGT